MRTLSSSTELYAVGSLPRRTPASVTCTFTCDTDSAIDRTERTIVSLSTLRTARMKRPEAANESNQVRQSVLLGLGVSSNEGNLKQ
jgi:hypothetical protein